MWLLILVTFNLILVMSNQETKPTWPPKIGIFEQTISHFNFPKGAPTFRQRFVYEDKWYEHGGPIFFYCGNEGNILGFWNNTGFMFDIAPTFKALIVFAEHRYYGESLPFESSFVQPYIQFLSIQESMADFADIIIAMKEKFNTTSAPVIAFGGSYGGMLAAYMRLRYPHLVTGAIASSAPFRWVSGETPMHPFFESIKEDYFSADPTCIPIFQAAYAEIAKRATEGPSGLQNISGEMHLCHDLENKDDLDWMLRWTRNAFVMMSMMDYPYSSSFMGNLPANPVNVSCDKAIKFGVANPLAGLREAVGVFYGGGSNDTCYDYKSQYVDCADITGCGLGDDSVAWDFQACTEIHLYDPSNATSGDIFPSLPKTLDDVDKHCYDKFGVRLVENQLITTFGPISAFKQVTNIVFSNGNLDPWAGGGIPEDFSSSAIILKIHGGAHHFDLREANPADPPSVSIARQAEIEAISKWLKEFERKRN